VFESGDDSIKYFCLLSHSVSLLIDVTDPLNLMYRFTDDSDYSVADSNDENIMEGGVTIQQQQQQQQTEKRIPPVSIIRKKAQIRIRYIRYIL